MRTLMIAVFFAVSLLVLGGEIADHFQRTQGKSVNRHRSDDGTNSTDHGITEIGIERGGWMYPTYTLTIKSDGTVHYSGDEYGRKGGVTGTIDGWQFHQLARFIRDSGYMELKDLYPSGATDGPLTYTTVVMNGKRKTIVDDTNEGPTKLWAIEQLIDHLMTKTKWDGSPKAPDMTP